MRERTIADVKVSEIGLGEMPMSIEGRPDQEQSVATIHAALDLGVTLIDTADAYHLYADDVGHGETLVATALRSYGSDTSHVLVATKGGHLRPGDGRWTVDGSPAHIKAACEASLRRLGVEAIGLYQHHRPDRRVPYADSIGALRDLLDEGKIVRAGISNANPAQIREALDILGGRLASVQNEFSPDFRTSGPELELCADLEIAFLPWGPLGGSSAVRTLGERHPTFAAVAAEVGASVQQVTLAWMLAQSPAVIPIPGSSRPETIRSSVAAAEIVLSPEQVARLDAAR